MHKQTITGVVMSSVLLATLFLLPATVSAQTNPDSGISGLLNQAQETLASLATDVGLLDDEEGDEQEEEDDSDVNVLTGRESQSPLLESKQDKQADNERNDTDGTVAGTSTQTSAELQAMLDQVQDDVDRLTAQIGIEDPNDIRNTNNASDQSISTNPDRNYVTADQLNSLKQTMYQNVESAVDTIDDTDDDTTYDAGSGLSLSDEDNIFSVTQGSDGIWNSNDSGDLYYDGGNVGINRKDPDKPLEMNGIFEMHNTGAVGPRFYAHAGKSWRGTSMKFYRSEGTEKSPALIRSGRTIGRIEFDGYDGSSYGQGGQIEVDAAEEWSTSTHGTRMSFQTAEYGSTNETERMRIAGNGNIGINETSPSKRLSVDGDTNITGTTTLATNEGKVGVGTNDPDSKFSMVGTLTAKAEGSDDSILIGDGSQNLTSSGESGDRDSVVIGGKNTAQASDEIPHASVQIGQESQTESTGNNYFQTVIGHEAEVRMGEPKNTVIGAKAYASSSDAVAVGYNSEVKRIEGSGKIARGVALGSGSSVVGKEGVAIGRRADVEGHNSITVGPRTNLTATSSAIIGSNTTHSNDDTYVYGHNVDGANPTKHGFGLTDPSYRLHVSTSSDGAVAGFTDTNGTCTINPTNTSLNCSSDRQLKKDITTLTDNEDILDNLNQLSPVTYRWNDQNNTADKQYGLIAQDVEDVFPEFVSEGPDGYKSLSYTSFIPVNTAAINQLNNKVNEIDKDTNASFWKDSQTASSSGTSTDTDNKTLTDTFLNAVAEAVGGVVENGQVVFNKLMTDTMVVRNDIEADTVTARDELCAGDTCVTESELKNLLDEETDDDSPVMDSKEDKQENENENNDDDENTDTDSEDNTDNQDNTSTTTDDQQDDNDGTVAGTSTDDTTSEDTTEDDTDDTDQATTTEQTDTSEEDTTTEDDTDTGSSTDSTDQQDGSDSQDDADDETNADDTDTDSTDNTDDTASSTTSS